MNPSSSGPIVRSNSTGPLDSHFPTVNGYILTNILGSGTYAKVYQGFKRETNEVVAIKCMKRSFMIRKNAADNIIREIEILKEIKNPHIVEMKDFQWDSEHIYLMLEYCSGGTLLDFIHSRRKLPEALARRFLRQLAIALRYLRTKHVCHRDLKPQNILISTRTKPVLKLADFGFAEYLQPHASSDSRKGSPLYMAPEILSADKSDAKCDLWSVGVILYECIYGEPPFVSPTYDVLLIKIISSEPIRLPGKPSVSPQCANLLLSLLQRDPSLRIDYDEFFSHPFVDLDELTLNQRLARGVESARRAVDADTAGDLQVAFRLYCEAAERLMEAVEEQTEPGKRGKLREKVNEYLDRAESIRGKLKPDRSGACRETRETLYSSSEINKIFADAPIILEYLGLGNNVYSLIEKEEYEEARDRLKVVLEVLLQKMYDLTPGERKDCLRLQCQRYMTVAESLTNYLNMGDVANQHRESSNQTNPNNSNVKRNSSSKSDESCCIQ